MSASPIVTTQAEFLLVEAALPGRGPETIGVLLYELPGGRLALRMRRDWDQWMGEDEEEVFTHLESEFTSRISLLGPEEFLRQGEDSFSHSIRFSERRPVVMDRFERTLDRLYRQHVPAKVQQFHTHLPVYSLQAAAGSWGVESGEVEAREWREAPAGLCLTEDMFVAQVVGRSMEPAIPDGSWCVFRYNVVGSRLGRKVLVENFEKSEQGGDRYTVKVYKSDKVSADDGEWKHKVIKLLPINPEFEAWDLTEGEQVRIIAEFLRVLD